MAIKARLRTCTQHDRLNGVVKLVKGKEIRKLREKMNAEQNIAFQLAEKGHNLFISGGPGTGKTYTLSKIVDRLLIDGKKVAVTASTGIAASVLREKITGCNVTTLHRFIGMKDGRFDDPEIVELIRNNDNYSTYKSNILALETLIIDEISMISEKTFNQLQHILRSLKNIEKPFGGVQLILSGDLHQLPPVPNIDYGDDGSLFISSKFSNFFHVCQLVKVVRQEEGDLIKAIHEIAGGELSMSSSNLIKRLCRKLPPGPEPVQLYSLNFDVDLCNARYLRDMDGEEHVYHATEEGVTKACAGEKELHLKLGCPVMLIVNLSDELVNGLRGIVQDMEGDGIEVYFPPIKKTVHITQYSFTKFCPILKKDIGSRLQFPLKLCFAMTIHKAQGMTLERVCIDCKGMFQYGQLVVAVSRASKKKGLQILNFSDKLLLKPPSSFVEFFKNTICEPLDDFSCCRHIDADEFILAASTPTNLNIMAVTVDNEELTSDDEIDLVKSVENFEKELISETMDIKYPIPPEVNVTQVLNGLIFETEETSMQRCENDAVKFLLSNLERTQSFLQYFWNELYQLKEKHMSADVNIENKTLTEFYGDYNQFMNGEKYKLNVRYLFEQNPSSEQYNVVFKLTSEVRKLMLQFESDPIRKSAQEKANREQGKVFDESEGGRGKIRYIAGWCLFKIKKNVKKKIQSNMYNRKKVDFVEQLVLQKKIIEHLEASEMDLRTSTDRDSLHETERRQNIRKGLTNVSDSCFYFFRQLDKKIRILQTESNLNVYGSKFSGFISTELADDTNLFRTWTDLFSAFPNKTENFNETVKSLLDSVFSKYILMSISQLRKEYLEKKNAKKLEATRKQIKMRTDSKKKQHFTFSSILSDTSVNRDASHKRLQSEVILNKSYLVNNFKKCELALLCEAYNVKFATSNTKQTISQKLEPVVLRLASIPRPELLNRKEDISVTAHHFGEERTDEPLLADSDSESHSRAGPSNEPMPVESGLTGNVIQTVHSKRKKAPKILTCKGKGKGKKKKQTIKWPCGICQADASVDSVGCDRCDTWFHSNCVKIEDLTALENEWFCQTCVDEMEKESE